MDPARALEALPSENLQFLPIAQQGDGISTFVCLALIAGIPAEEKVASLCTGGRHAVIRAMKEVGSSAQQVRVS